MVRSSFFQTPEPPQAPDAPQVPRSDKLRSRVRVPRSTVPATENAAFMARYAAWQASGYPQGSMLEYLVWEYLVTKKAMKPGVDFVYQSPVLGGRTQFGGFVVDFFVRPNLALQPQGEHWHLASPSDRARLRLESSILAGRGIKAIYLWESDLLARSDYAIERALNGQQLNTFRTDL